jgi:hypothetical protein
MKERTRSSAAHLQTVRLSHEKILKHDKRVEERVFLRLDFRG